MPGRQSLLKCKVVCRGRWVEKISFGLLKDVRSGVGRLLPVPVQRLHILGRSYFHPELLNLLVRLANAVAVCRGNMATMNSNMRSKLNASSTTPIQRGIGGRTWRFFPSISALACSVSMTRSSTAKSTTAACSSDTSNSMR